MQFILPSTAEKYSGLPSRDEYSVMPVQRVDDIDPDDGGVCCVPQGSETTSRWKYVGYGHGSYRQLPAYNYVGEGVGNFQKEQVTGRYGCQPRPCCLGLTVLPLLAWAGYLLHRTELIPVHAAAFLVKRTTPAPTPRPTLPRYKCIHHIPPGGDAMAMVASWSKVKQVWCCTNEGIGCTTTLAPTTTTSLPYDCAAGYLNWQAGWSLGKKDWCCRHYGRGCPTTSSLPYDCHAGYANWEDGWSQGKQEWCCRRYNRGCPMPSTTSAWLPYDCSAGYANWERGWSPGKKTWCCRHGGGGCTVATTSLPQDCAGNPSGWSHDKISWCCQHDGRGCSTTTALDTYDCDADFSTCDRCVKALWSARKRSWCCQHQRRGCPTTTTPEHYNCNAGLANWKNGWSTRKRTWCCHHYRLGCPGSQPS